MKEEGGRMKDWADWQLNYLYGLFVIWPPDGVRQAVNRLRQAYDPVSQSTIEAHITLTQPFLTQPDDEDWARLGQIVAGFEPFEIRYGPVSTFFPNPVIYLEIQPQGELLALRQALHGTGLFNLTLPYTDDFLPHMTISESQSNNVADEAMLAEVRSQAPQGAFMMNEVVCVTPDRHFHFEISKSLVLAGR